MFEIRLFGAIEVLQQGQPIVGFRSQKTLALLAYLIVEERPLARDYLAGLLWPETTQSDALGHLRRALYNLTSLLPDCFDVDRRTVRFRPQGPAAVDLYRFRQLSQLQEPRQWAEAVELVRAPLLEGFYLEDCSEFEAWMTVERERWAQAVSDLLEALCQQHLAGARFEPALVYAQRLVRFEPWREDRHRQLMILLARTGQREAALAQFHRCQQIMMEELGLAPSTSTTTLYERIRDLSVELHNLPVDPTPFTGRSLELAHLQARLNEPGVRLITLRGPGGVGKTRLVIELARLAAPAFLEGVWFIDLARVESVEHLLLAIGNAIGMVRQEGIPPRQQLLQYLADRELLLVLDNFEHLYDARVLLSEILQAAPQVKLLVTSRRDLSLRQENLYTVTGLTYPETPTPQQAAGNLLESEAVSFLVQAIRRYRAHFDPAAHIAALLEICRLVDGSPLALELAAASLRALSVEDVSTTIRENLDLLQTTHADVPPRHRSVRAAFEHSWRLLNATERSSFLKLTIFAGGFTLDAAQQVADIPFAQLQALNSHSLLQLSDQSSTAGSSATARYHMHELLHQYARERLQQSPSFFELKKRHARYYLSQIIQCEEGLEGDPGPQARSLLAIDWANIVAAWRSATQYGYWALLAGSAGAIARFQMYVGQARAALELVNTALDHCHELSAEERTGDDCLLLQARLRAVQARLLVHLGHIGESIQVAESASRMANEIGDKHTALIAGYAQSLALFNQGMHVESRAAAEAMLELIRKSQTTSEKKIYEGLLLNMVGRTWLESDRAKARRYFEQALERGLAGSHRLQTAALINLSLVEGSEGLYNAARQRLNEALHLAQDHGYRELLGTIHLNAGTMAFHLGLYPEGKEHYEAALAAYRRGGHRARMNLGYHSRSVVAAEAGEYREAQRDAQQALEICRQAGLRLREGMLQLWHGHLLRILGRYDQAAQELNAAQKLLQEIEAPVRVMESCWRLAWFYIDIADSPSAHRQLQAANDLLRDQQPPEEQCRTLLSWSRYWYAQQDLFQARENGEAALEIARSTNPRLIPECTVHLGHVLTASGALEEARQHFDETLAIRLARKQEHLCCEAYAGFARLALLTNDLELADQYATLVLDFLEQSNSWQKIFGLQQPFYSLYTCGQVLMQRDDHRASFFLRRVREALMERAFTLTSEQRDLFLTTIPAHHALMSGD